MTIIILGGGYAGVLCANRLRSSLSDDEARRVRVVLVNPSDRFHERIRLHELVAGSRPSVAVPLASVLHRDVRVVVGTAERVDAAGRVVDVRSGADLTRLAYDALVYAVGSVPAMATPGARQHAFAVGAPESAAAARAAIASAPADQRIVVVGGGFTGVETASEVAERHPHARVVLVSGGPVVAGMRPEARRSVLRALRRLGVSVREGVRVERVESGRLVASEPVEFDVCLWAASFSVPDLAVRSGLTTDALGRLRVDDRLRSVDSPAIVGAGDAVRLPDPVGRHVRMGCAVALPLGGAAARTVLATLRGEDPEPVSVGYVLQCLSLGRRSGYVQVVHADDTPRALAVRGRPAAAVKEAICRLTVAGTRWESSRPGAFWSPRGPRPAPDPQPVAP